jgi:hypothetical protein
VDEEAYMTQKEVHRAEVFARLSQRHITKTQAAVELNISLRQLFRLYNQHKHIGRDALRSKKRGKPSNHQLANEIKEQVLDIVARDIYAGFGPKFMCEKLEELHGIKISKETVRQLMIQSGVWLAKSKKCPVIHQQRKRRARYGELVQIDGSPHDWFEDRGERCTLLVYIDDATGRAFGKFAPVECTESYMDITRDYIKKFGIPRCFYSDRHGIFRINREGCVKETSFTQFGRALKDLDIELICANSPQAKGRVERANKTLQDRLVKDLRLAGIKTIEEANNFLDKSDYWTGFNKKFAVTPVSQENAHKDIPSENFLDEALCFKETRTLTKNLEFQYDNVIYQVLPEDHLRVFRGAHVSVIKKLDGSISLECKGKKIRFKEYRKQVYAGQQVDAKEIDRFLKEKLPRVVPDNHPWKRRKSHAA